MSRFRAFVHASLTAAALVLVTAWAASAVPLRTDEPGGATASSPPARAITPAKLVHRVDPSYPADAKAEGVQGIFMLEVVLGKDGAVRLPRVVVSAPTRERLDALTPRKGTSAALEGDSRLASAAMEAVTQWRYEPVLQKGEPIEVELTVVFAFKLDDKPKASAMPRPEEVPSLEPKLVHRVNPTYPSDAKAEKVEGHVLIALVVGKDGSVAEARVAASAPTKARLEELRGAEGTEAPFEGDRRLEVAALASIRQWRFEPQLRDGQPVETRVFAPVAFQIF